MAEQIGKPGSDEYGAYYADYVARVPGDDALAVLAGQMDVLGQLLGAVGDEQANGTFAPGEWSIKEVVGHLVDAERAFGYRIFAFSRAEPSPLPSFDQDSYVREAQFDARPLPELLEELALLRRANLLAYRHLTPEIALRRGVASGVGVSVRALLFILAGHLEYHLADLRAKYLPALGV